MAFRFRKFKVYIDAKNLHIKINQIIKIFPPKYYYLNDQIKRASLSIVLNIAEGSSKQSDRDFNRFLTMSLGSLDETVACLEVALEENLISDEQFNHLINDCEELSRQLGGYSKKLKSTS